MLRESENVSRSVSCFIVHLDTKGFDIDKTTSVTENRLTTFANSDDYRVQF